MKVENFTSQSNYDNKNSSSHESLKVEVKHDSLTIHRILTIIFNILSISNNFIIFDHYK